MILTGFEIKNRLATDIIITEFDKKRLNPNSYDLRLHDELMMYTDHCLDFKVNDKTETIKIPEEGLIIYPGILYLARTIEWTETYNLVPSIDGKSSVGRKGLCVHVTAGFGDIGFKGCWTLEMTCIHPVRIYPGMRICQIKYQTILGNYSKGYQGKYQCQGKIESSKSYEDEEL